MLGNQVKHKAMWTNHDEPMKKGDDQEDTLERLERVAKSFKKSNTIVHEIIELFVENTFKEMNVVDIQATLKENKIVLLDYTIWEDAHGCNRIIENIGENLWKLTPIIKQHLNL